MTSSVSRKDIEEIKPYLDKTIQRFLGINEPALLTTALNCLSSGYNETKTAIALSSLLDESKAAKLTEKIFDAVTKYRKNDKGSRKRQKTDDFSSELAKKKKMMDSVSNPPSIPSANSTSLKVKEMMKAIDDRNRKQTSMPNMMVAPPSLLPNRGPQSAANDKANRIAMLQANIQSKVSSGLLNSILAKTLNGAPSDKPTPLILDSEGRTVDVTGKEVQLTHITPTLKANIRAKKREEFKAQFQQQTPDSLSDAHFFDPRIAAKAALRNKRALRFHEPGKFQQLAETMRAKAQLERLQGEIFQIAKKTGISSAAKLALIAPKTQSQEEQVPLQEWWDSVVSDFNEESGEYMFKPETISHLVEHPTQMKPPSDPLKPIFLPVLLTQKERKKLRRQNRREAWKEEQEKIRLGLEPPPEPKLRISNLMRVLGTEAVQDPTKMEAHVRAQMAKRQKAHEDANAARKLTAEQRKEKKIRKLEEDTTLGVHVAVYRVSELSNPSKKFKVETNAKQLFLTGCVVLFKDCNIIVVEGGPKQINKYNRLMTHRIKWEEDVLKGEDQKGGTNQCVLVWKGTVKERSFGEMKFKVCPSEKLARDFLKKAGVEHYWDLAYSGTVLDHTDDIF